MSSSNSCFLTWIQISQEADQVVWYSHLFQNFPQFIVIASPVINIPLQSGTFVIHTPISAHHHHPKSIMYIWTHSWCCIFCVFAWVYKYVYLPLYFIHSIFTALNDYLFLPPFLQISGNYSLLNFLQKKRKKVVTQSCSTLCDPRDCSPPGSSVHGILQARMLE